MRKRDRIAKFVGFYGLPALKRDLRKIALAEDRSLSDVVCGLLRLGIGRYFELADAKMVAPLLAKMRDVFWSEDDPFESETGANAKRARLSKRATDAAMFDAAIDEGLREFEGARPIPAVGRTPSSACPSSRPLADGCAPLSSRLSPEERLRRAKSPAVTAAPALRDSADALENPNRLQSSGAFARCAMECATLLGHTRSGRA